MKRTTLVVATTVLVSGLWLATPSLAQEPRPEGKPTLSDAEFVKRAAAAGLAEVNLGMLAAKRASTDEVKQFAQRTVTDHNKANRELLALANKKQILVPGMEDAEHQALYTRLARLQGAEFDRAYMESQVRDHQKAVALFEAKAQDAQDEEIKTWASKTLPTLQEHLRMAQDLARMPPTEANK